jgi:hypothetical protein
MAKTRGNDTALLMIRRRFQEKAFILLSVKKNPAQAAKPLERRGNR